MEIHERVENRLNGASVDVGIQDRRRMLSSKERERWRAALEVETENQIYLGYMERSRFGVSYQVSFQIC